jgi:hypothetical protein
VAAGPDLTSETIALVVVAVILAVVIIRAVK